MGNGGPLELSKIAHSHLPIYRTKAARPKIAAIPTGAATAAPAVTWGGWVALVVPLAGAVAVALHELQTVLVRVLETTLPESVALAEAAEEVALVAGTELEGAGAELDGAGAEVDGAGAADWALLEGGGAADEELLAGAGAAAAASQYLPAALTNSPRKEERGKSVGMKKGKGNWEEHTDGDGDAALVNDAGGGGVGDLDVGLALADALAVVDVAGGDGLDGVGQAGHAARREVVAGVLGGGEAGNGEGGGGDELHLGYQRRVDVYIHAGIGCYCESECILGSSE